MRPNNATLMNAVSNTGTQTSLAIPIEFMMQGSFQASFTDGTAAGTLAIQVSDDPYSLLPGNEAPLNWSTLPNGSATISSGATTLIGTQLLSYKWLRAEWTSTGGAGTLTVNTLMQGFN
jgi:hypothetical protein